MAQRLAELCSLLVENAYGDLAAQIFSTLAERGRLSLISLRQLSGIPPRRLKAGLTTLIQHHIVLYNAVDEDEPTYFQVDWHTAYVLVRLRKLIKVVKDREGEAAGQIISNILQLGHASVGDLADEYDLTPSSKRDSGIDTVEEHMTEDGLINGIAKKGKPSLPQDKNTSVSKFHGTLRSLLAKGFLVKVNERTYLSPADLQERVRDTVIAEHFPGGRITGPKKEKVFQLAVKNLKRKWQDDDNYSDTRDIGSHGEIKRCSPPSSSNKRVKSKKLSNGVNHRDHYADEDRVEEFEPRADKLPNDMAVRVNFAKCTTLLRNQRLAQTAHRFLGPATAAVYGALLRSLESKAKVKIDDGSGDEESLPSAIDNEVYEHLDTAIDLVSKFKCVKAAPKQPKGVRKHRNKAQVVVDDDDDATQLGIKTETHSDSEDELDVDGNMIFKERKKRLLLIDMHLNILAEHPKRFCIRETGSNKSKVDFASMAKMLIGLELETMINARFGKIPTRFVRILRESGKVDVQQIADMTMTRHNDACAWLTSLQFAGLAHGQELAKDNGHQTSRAVHLWWFDEKSVASQYLARTYQGMSRTLQRLRFERETKFKAAIDKAERIDVKGREHELLNQQDKEELRKWQDVEEQMLVQVARLDDLVAVLRDFSGNDTSLTT